MTASIAFPPPHADERADFRRWARASAPVLGAHAIAIAAAILWNGTRPAPPPLEPPIAMELAPLPVADQVAVARPATAAAPSAASPAPPSPSQPALAPATEAPPVARSPVPPPVAMPLPAPVRPAMHVDTPPAAAPGGSAATPGTANVATGTGSGSAAGSATGRGPATGAGHGAAAVASASTGDAGAVWRGRIQKHLDRNKQYPAAARLMKRFGSVRLAATIDRQGRVLVAAISKGTGFKPIDDEAMATLRRSEPLPAPPAEVGGNAIPMALLISFDSK